MHAYSSSFPPELVCVHADNCVPNQIKQLVPDCVRAFALHLPPPCTSLRPARPSRLSGVRACAQEGLLRFVRKPRDCEPRGRTPLRRPAAGSLGCDKLVWAAGINGHGDCAAKLADDYAAAVASAR